MEVGTENNGELKALGWDSVHVVDIYFKVYCRERCHTRGEKEKTMNVSNSWISEKEGEGKCSWNVIIFLKNNNGFLFLNNK